jgi:hypothetical protein
VPKADLPLLDCPADIAADTAMLGLLGYDRPITVPRIGDRPAAACYANVAALVSAHGGQPLFGWMLSWIPGLLVQAMHHAIWVKPDGQAVDPTAPQGSYRPRQGTTTFIQDRMGEDRLADRWIANRHHVLAADPDVVDYLAAYHAHHGAYRGMQVAGNVREDPKAPPDIREAAALEWDRLAPKLAAAQAQIRSVQIRLSARYPTR